MSVEPDGVAEYYDFYVPGTNNYWAEGVIHHNSCKTTFAEALAVATRYVYATSSFSGFHSGYKLDKEGTEDFGLIPKINHKTFIVKDGDTILGSPYRDKILAEARDLFDGTARSHYLHGVSHNYPDVRVTWVLCGTSALRFLDQSELGARFIDCLIMDGIDTDFEREVNRRVAYRALRNVKVVGNGRPESRTDPAMLEARRLTAGYVHFLRENADELLARVQMTEDQAERVIDMGEFVAMMRARPSVKQDEVTEREFSSRLVEQYVRLTCCLAAATGRPKVDEGVMAQVRTVALDTGRGRALEIVRALADAHAGRPPHRGRVDGLPLGTLLHEVHADEEAKWKKLVRFLRRIKAVRAFVRPGVPGVKGVTRYALTERMRYLYESLTGEAVT